VILVLSAKGRFLSSSGAWAANTS